MTVNLLDFDARRADRRLVRCRWAKNRSARARCCAGCIALGSGDFDGDDRYRQSLREKLRRWRSWSPPVDRGDKLSDDGTRKFLIDVGGGNAVETVFIPRTTAARLCVSTQAGCALDCAFLLHRRRASTAT